ncbi:hypothetical protein D0T50_12805 [Bacteroides sp. 214]|nr:hypothetical protein [Bacteroides sp. 214]
MAKLCQRTGTTVHQRWHNFANALAQPTDVCFKKTAQVEIFVGACLPFTLLLISPEKQPCAKTLLRGVFQPQILDASTLYT